jgi:hypothetical protein
MVALGVQAGQDTPVVVDAGARDFGAQSERDAASPDESPIIAPGAPPLAVDGGTVSPSDAQPASLDGTSPDDTTPAPLAVEMPPSSVTSVPEPEAMVAHTERAVPGPVLRHFGVGIDFGLSGILPDAGLLLTARPVRWGQLQLGAGYNGFAPGVRGGLTVCNPFVIPLTLTWEAGHYFEGDANRLVHWVDSNAKSNVSLERFGYDYMNLLGGLSVGDRDFAFYLRFGITWMRTTVHGFEQAVRETTKLDVTASDPTIHYRGPALKVGFDYFL